VPFLLFSFHWSCRFVHLWYHSISSFSCGRRNSSIIMADLFCIEQFVNLIRVIRYFPYTYYLFQIFLSFDFLFILIRFRPLFSY
jgi:hypothetical protein